MSVPLRRGAVAVAISLAAVAPGVAASPTALAAAAPASAAAQSPILDEQGLFGDADPTTDGVWRQSLALLAQTAAGVDPGGEAIGWLRGQQCDDGSFLAYRADVGRPCADVTAADTNATALAAQALAAVGGQGEAVDAALTWLRGVQNEDGGWSFMPGDASDANSTAVVAGAFAAAGEDPAEVRREDASPYDALAGMQLGCEAAEEQRGAFAWQPDAETGELFANDAATVDAVLAAHGSGLLVDPERAESAEPGTPPSCDAAAGGGEGASEDGAQTAAAQAGAAGAAYLTGVLEENDQHLVMLTQDGEELPDFGSTADAVLALVVAGDAEAAQGPLGWLQENLGSWAGYAKSPAALSTLVLAAHAAGASPEDFGGTDLVAALSLLDPTQSEDADGAATDEAAAGEDDGAGAVSWILALVAVVVVVGVLLAVVQRRSRNAGEAAGADPADPADGDHEQEQGEQGRQREGRAE
ncbi:hypothetical protein [Streptomyces sp. 6N223]|uniref:hypothetical protein n=1 Tax=Streptomyces sp. 6N223 TaxID=3457412 RepID=UPI003FD130EF